MIGHTNVTLQAKMVFSVVCGQFIIDVRESSCVTYSKSVLGPAAVIPANLPNRNLRTGRCGDYSKGHV